MLLTGSVTGACATLISSNEQCDGDPSLKLIQARCIVLEAMLLVIGMDDLGAYRAKNSFQVQQLSLSLLLVVLASSSGRSASQFVLGFLHLADNCQRRRDGWWPNTEANNLDERNAVLALATDSVMSLRVVIQRVVCSTQLPIVASLMKAKTETDAFTLRRINLCRASQFKVNVTSQRYVSLLGEIIVSV